MILVDKLANYHHTGWREAWAFFASQCYFYRAYRGSAAAWVAAALLLCLAGCSGEAVQRFSGSTMGSTYTISYVGRSAQAQDLQRGVEAILKQLDAEVSTYRKDSTLAAFNAAPAGHCQTMPQSVATMLGMAQAVWRDSAQALDVSLLPALGAWGFGPQGRVLRQPDAATLAALRSRVGLGHFVWNGANLANTNSLKTSDENPAQYQLCKMADAQLEFNSMAAGYAIDQIGGYLKSQGIQNYLIEVTGELAGSGQKPDGSPWRIGIESPKMGEKMAEATANQNPQIPQAQRILALRDMAISTSGDYRQYFEENGRRYSHILDPRTLAPIEHALASVTVGHSSAMAADAWSTALMAMGPQAGLALAQEKDLAAFFIVKQGDDFVVHTTPAFERYFGAGH